MNDWISVKEGYPDNGKRVLACATILFPAHMIVFHRNHHFHNLFTDEDVTKYITHWMFLPELPCKSES